MGILPQSAHCRLQGQNRRGPRWGAYRHQVPRRLTSRQEFLWGFTHEGSGDLLRPGCRHWGWGTQAGCCATSYSLCWAHPPPSPTHTEASATCRPRYALPLRAQMGTEAQTGGQAPQATISQPRTLIAPLKKPLQPQFSSPYLSVQQKKQMTTSQLRSRAAPGAMRAARGRVSLCSRSLHGQTFPYPAARPGSGQGSIPSLCSSSFCQSTSSQSQCLMWTARVDCWVHIAQAATTSPRS